jgi:hypothetical protein
VLRPSRGMQQQITEIHHVAGSPMPAPEVARARGRRRERTQMARKEVYAVRRDAVVLENVGDRAERAARQAGTFVYYREPS